MILEVITMKCKKIRWDKIKKKELDKPKIMKVLLQVKNKICNNLLLLEIMIIIIRMIWVRIVVIILNLRKRKNSKKVLVYKAHHLIIITIINRTTVHLHKATITMIITRTLLKEWGILMAVVILMIPDLRYQHKWR